MSDDKKEVDLYRDTPVRLLGYANEVGESFRALIHVNWVRFSYGVASAYTVADTYDKTKKMAAITPTTDPNRTKKLAYAATDTLLWQAFASVIIPGFTINRVCATSLFLLKKYSSLPKTTRAWTTTFVGLGCIPFIVKPIDHLVDYGMDNTLRKFVEFKE